MNLYARYLHAHIDSDKTRKFYGDDPLLRWIPAGIRGFTRCELYDDDDQLVAVGFAVCSMKDNFNRKIGRNIAHQRARWCYETGKKFISGRKGVGFISSSKE